MLEKSGIDQALARERREGASRFGFRRFLEQSLEPVDIAWLAMFRVLFGALMAVSLSRFIAFGWVEAFFIRPTFHFKYFGFHWVHVLPPDGMHALFWGLLLLSVCITLGLFFRVTASLFALGFAYLQLVDVTTYLNHYYLASLLAILLALSPAHRAWSLDAHRLPKLRREHVPRYWHQLFCFQVAVVYTFAGIAKMSSDWLIHAQPLRIWLGSRTDLPLLGPLFQWEGAALVMSWAGCLFDSSIAWFLSFKKTRLLAYAVVVIFHLTTSLLFPIGMFPVIMVVSALVFFPPEWPRKLLCRAAVNIPTLPTATAMPLKQRFALGLLVAYCAVQALVPLRFLLYGGDVRWHEQGMRFSWRVMVREKNGSVTFLVRSPQQNRSWQVSPSRYLNRLQEREMAGQPDLILQLAQHIAHEFEARGSGPVEVRVDALASLNGRKLAPLIDPEVNLAAVSDGLARADWILPAPQEQPPHLRPARVASQ